MNSKKMDLGSKDFISSLPDALLCHILSFLSTNDAALTSVLSKRWRYLLAFVPNLDFDSSIHNRIRRGGRKSYLMRRSFKAFVNRILALQGNAPLNKFSLKCKIRNDKACLDGWLLNVLDRGVVDLDLYLIEEYQHKLPSKLVMCKTLVSLKVGGGNQEFNYIDVEDVFLPKLKTLYLYDNVSFEESGVAFAKLISGCPVLEELVMIDKWWDFLEVCSVANQTLKKLIIDCETTETPLSVSFDTPNLVYLEYSDLVAVTYPKVNFGSLVEANLGLRMTRSQLFDARSSLEGYSSTDEEKEMVVNATGFFMGMSNVKILYLSSGTLEVLTFCCKAIPVFNNLVHLTIETGQEVTWKSLPNLLENCPILETLVFQRLHYRDTNQCSDERHSFKDTSKCYVKGGDRCMCKPWPGTPVCMSSSPVKMLKVLNFGQVTSRKYDIEKQTELIKYFLETMPNLEEVVLYYDTPFESDLNIVSTELQMLEKVASRKCKIQIVSDTISFSSTVHSSSSTNGLVFFNHVFPV